MRKHYTVAGHGFIVDAEDSVFTEMKQYQPFMDDEDSNTLFSLRIQKSDTPIIYRECHRQEDEGASMICGETPDGKTVLEFQIRNEVMGRLVCNHDFTEGDVYYTGRRFYVVNNSLMMMYTFITSDKCCLIFLPIVRFHIYVLRIINDMMVCDDISIFTNKKATSACQCLYLFWWENLSLVSSQ